MASKKAWVTLATDDTYSLGALVLAHSLKKVKTAYDLVVLVTSNVTLAMRGTLKSIFNEVREVNILDSEDVDNLRLLARPELGITFTKLHCWKLTQYEKCVFLDADTLVLKNCDELFEREELSAAPDVGWPDCFNSGVFVFKPSEETYNAITNFAITHGSYDGADQGLLNMYFSGWSTGDSNKRLPFLYNLTSAAIYSYLPAFKWYGKDVKIIHFISNSKPWLQPFNSVTRTVHTAAGSTHLTNFLQYWWDLYCSNVHLYLSPEMTRLLLGCWFTPPNPYKNNPIRNNPICLHYDANTWSETPAGAPETDEEYFVFTDPWEEFIEKNKVDGTESHYNASVGEPFTDVENNIFKNYNDFTDVHSCQTTHFNDCPKNEHADSNHFHTYSDDHQNPTDNASICTDGVHCEPNTNDERLKCQYIQNFFSSHATKHEIFYDDVYQVVENYVRSDSTENYSSSNNSNVYYTNSTPAPAPNSLNEVITAETDNSVNNRETIVYDGGLASSFSQMKLEEPTPEQIAQEDSQRRENWEQGNIDYLGRDSFDNIWSKITETIGQQSEPKLDTVASAEPVGSPVTGTSSESFASAPTESVASDQIPPAKAGGQQPESGESCAKPEQSVVPPPSAKEDATPTPTDSEIAQKSALSSLTTAEIIASVTDTAKEPCEISCPKKPAEKPAPKSTGEISAISTPQPSSEQPAPSSVATSESTVSPPSPSTVAPPSPTAVVPPSPTEVVPPSPTAVVPPSPTAAVPPSPTAAVPPSPTAIVPPSPTAVVPPSPTTVVPPSPATVVPPELASISASSASDISKVESKETVKKSSSEEEGKSEPTQEPKRKQQAPKPADSKKK